MKEMSRLVIAARTAKLAFSVPAGYVHFRLAFRRSRRAFGKALRMGGVPRAAVEELVREYDTLRTKLLSLLKR